jgi:hypothetical protein
MRKSIFKINAEKTNVPDSPEALFQTLRTRSHEIKHLWSHQADILREYHKKAPECSDIALELPTGSGKTLVGLLIAEWRRRVNNERVVYLCPTRQLAQQVNQLSEKYGIKTSLLIGKQKNYSPQAFSSYQMNNSIAITTYSGIFNINPRIDDAHTIVLDDAHAGEIYLSQMWSVEISRSKNKDLYMSITALLKDFIPDALFEDIHSDDHMDPSRSTLVDYIPAKAIRENGLQLRSLLDSTLNVDESAYHSWNQIKDHLPSCNIFISANSILIKPLMPPTMTHKPFSSAKQRVYMSATLGRSGDLERITGVKSITRIPMPMGWDKQGSGRRLFLFPEIELASSDMTYVVDSALKSFDRSLVLVPSKKDSDASYLIESVENAGVKILEANDIEENINAFTSTNNACLLLSRYEGLDLADDACRLLIIGGLPNGANLQEKFIWHQVVATSVYKERVLTRFTQGVGRCTRSDSDYAIILVVGIKLVDFILKTDNRRILDSELQAELKFGIEFSREKTLSDYQDIWASFLSHDDDWQDFEETVEIFRDEILVQDDPSTDKLYKAASFEIDYIYYLWSNDLENALSSARKVVDLIDGDDLKAYRAWWLFLISEISLALFEDTGKKLYEETSKDFFTRASRCFNGATWITRLKGRKSDKSETIVFDELSSLSATNIKSLLSELGTVGKKFDKKIEEVGENLKQNNHKQFHQGLLWLGRMLGFISEVPDANADPDCIWSLGKRIYITHEAKSEHSHDGSIGAGDIRQAQSHQEWIASNKAVSDSTEIICLIESPRKKVEPTAKIHAKALYLFTQEDLLRIYSRSSNMLRSIRAKSSTLNDESIIEEIINELLSYKLNPQEVVDKLKYLPIKNL